MPMPCFGTHEPVRLPGGCLDCDAYRTFVAEAPGLYLLTVHHDETCPAYRQLKEPR
jgi:hypothetical protein